MSQNLYRKTIKRKSVTFCLTIVSSVLCNGFVPGSGFAKNYVNDNIGDCCYLRDELYAYAQLWVSIIMIYPDFFSVYERKIGKPLLGPFTRLSAEGYRCWNVRELEHLEDAFNFENEHNLCHQSSCSLYTGHSIPKNGSIKCIGALNNYGSSEFYRVETKDRQVMNRYVSSRLERSQFRNDHVFHWPNTLFGNQDGAVIVKPCALPGNDSSGEVLVKLHGNFLLWARSVLFLLGFFFRLMANFLIFPVLCILVFHHSSLHRRRNKMLAARWTTFFGAAVLTASVVTMGIAETDVGENLRSGTGDLLGSCLGYNSTSSTFFLNCTFKWEEAGFANKDYIKLYKNELFEGNGFEIDIENIDNWHGLIRIEASNNPDKTPTSLLDAPTIRNVHIRGGRTIPAGGFIVQRDQNHFIVEFCSSSGIINGICGDGGSCFGGGGICGNECSGEIVIRDSYSTGHIEGNVAGGIAGRFLGHSGGNVTILRCFSMGEIAGHQSGGICGHRAGDDGGYVRISQCHSEGDIVGDKSGGICGHAAGHTNGVIEINECYSLGDILGNACGGIVGRRAGHSGGFVTIANCYSRGAIGTGNSPGGICGTQAGHNAGTVIIENVYSSGKAGPESGGGGGIIGQIDGDAQQIEIRSSVHNGGKLVYKSNDFSYKSYNNSNNLQNISGKVFCYRDHSCWDTSKIWTIIPSDSLPRLQFEISRALITTTGIDDNGRPVQNAVSPCFHYEPFNTTFSLSCSFNWTDHFSAHQYIRLFKEEIFEGNGYSIDLKNQTRWSGLIQIESDNHLSPGSYQDAPVIRNVHMRGGQTSPDGGFVVKALQKHFVVASCSSSGIISGEDNPLLLGGGGICGQRCSGDIHISQCYSTGDIIGPRAGGIVGRHIGYQRGNVTIADCQSSGNIVGSLSGGICGQRAGEAYAKIHITRCFSMGKIMGFGSGGICGGATGFRGGVVEISQCYSTGEINGDRCGGIIGQTGGHTNGHLTILDSYSRGSISGGDYPGGICGKITGNANGTVLIKNVYASGVVNSSSSSGGIIGGISKDASQIWIELSVYNGMDNVSLIGDSGGFPYSSIKNSNHLQGISKLVYCYANNECWNTDTIWTVSSSHEYPVLQFQGFQAVRGLSDEGRPIRRFVTPCLDYDPEHLTFSLLCSFNWAQFFDKTAFLRLYKNEVFDGRGFRIVLQGLTEWDGLVDIQASNMPNGPLSLDDAPVIRNVQFCGGTTSAHGGFVVRRGQSNFIVESCSSSGVIWGDDDGLIGGGGICGDECSGYIRIFNCSSRGNIAGARAGGIAGRRFGFDGGNVTIVRSFSSGDILGKLSGGLCGNSAAWNGGEVRIFQSFTKGAIRGRESGGIIGGGAGFRGTVQILQSFAIGNISGRHSGGLLGTRAGRKHGKVTVLDSYSRGNIMGNGYVGGICGGLCGSEHGTLHLRNVYASGDVMSGTAGALIGSVANDAKQVLISMSVYNGEPMVRSGKNNTDDSGTNSENLKDIERSVYCNDEGSCWDTVTIWSSIPIDRFPTLQFEGLASLPTESSYPIPSPTSTIQPALSPSDGRLPSFVSGTPVASPIEYSPSVGSLQSISTSSSQSTLAPSESPDGSELLPPVHSTSNPSSTPSQSSLIMQIPCQYPARAVVVGTEESIDP